MESGFGQNLEGFLIKGNLSLAPAELPNLQGDGSIEASGTLYINNLTEYGVDNGVNIQNAVFNKDKVYVPYVHPSTNATSASFVIDGGISINHTANSLSKTQGGALTISGGASFGKNVNIGGELNMNSNKVINVPLPDNGTDVANKDYVDSVANKLSGNFSTGQVIIGENDGTAIKGYTNFTFDGDQLNVGGNVVISVTQDSVGLTTGALVVEGGASISKNLYLGGELDLNDNLIRNVAQPLLGDDVATKQYVDDNKLQGNFTTGQIIIAASVGDEIRGYENLLYDGYTISLNSTLDATNLTTGAFVCFGGISISKNVFIGGTLDVSTNKIVNVGEPNDPSDVATKNYVDSKTYGNILGSVGANQLVIGTTDPSILTSYPSLEYNGTLLTLGTAGSFNILNPTNAVGLGSGGALTISGGASIEKDVYIGGTVDVGYNYIKNVATPIEDYDAVNKAYLDASINDILSQSCCDETNYYETTFTLNNNVFTPEDIPDFIYEADIKAFIAYIYVEYDGQECCLYTIRGINRDSSWYISPTFIGEETNVNFFIRESDGMGIMQYTNKSSSGTTTIRFRTAIEVNTLASVSQINYTLSYNLTFTDIPGLSFLNEDIDSNKILVYVSSAIHNRHGLYFLNCVLKGDDWVMNTHSFGNIQGIRFNILSTATYGKIQYYNSNTTDDYVIRVRQVKIEKSQNEIVLDANTFTPTNVSSTYFEFPNIKTNFQATVFVELPDIERYALYELEGFYCDGSWKLNSRFIGDRTGIEFSILTTSTAGYLRYTNSNGVDAIIKYLKNTPQIFQPLSVEKGGTGNVYLEPYAVLRGNGIDPILGTSDFIYQDNKLILGNDSSIILYNTQNAINLTSGGTLTTYGGVAINKNLLIGETLVVDDIDITPSLGDITAERGFYGENDQATPTDVTGYTFEDISIKSFTGVACVTITTDDDVLDSLYELKGLRKKNGWILNATYIGDNLGVKFSITSLGQVQYTSTNIPDWVSTRMKFRAMTTTV